MPPSRPPSAYRPESFEPLTDAALLAASCLEADARFPVLDGWD